MNLQQKRNAKSEAEIDFLDSWFSKECYSIRPLMQIDCQNCYLDLWVKVKEYIKHIESSKDYVDEFSILHHNRSMFEF